MKNIYEILAQYGMAVEEEHRGEFEKQLFANYKTVHEMEKKDGRIAQLEQALAEKDEKHAMELAEKDFSQMLHSAITTAKGRNPKAILALLDQESLKQAEDPADQIQKTLEQLQKTDGYLFDTRPTPPLYARGTGAQNPNHKKAPTTLAGALQERFSKERK